MQILFPKSGLNFHFHLPPRRVEKAHFGIHSCVSKSRMADGCTDCWSYNQSLGLNPGLPPM